MIRTSFRLPIATIQRLDSIAADLQKRHIGKITRADVLRMLIQNGLTHLEPPRSAREAPPPNHGKKGKTTAVAASPPRRVDATKPRPPKR